MTNFNVHGSCGEAREHTTPSFMRRTAKFHLKWTKEVNASESEWHFVEPQTLNWKVSHLRLKWLRVTFTTQNTFHFDPSKFTPQPRIQNFCCIRYRSYSMPSWKLSMTWTLRKKAFITGWVAESIIGCFCSKGRNEAFRTWPWALKSPLDKNGSRGRSWMRLQWAALFSSGFLRAQGRVRKATFLPFEQKHPIILSATHPAMCHPNIAKLVEYVCARCAQRGFVVVNFGA